MLEDTLLVLKLKRKSTEALRRIYEKYRDDLLRISVSLVGSTAAAEDIVHDVFARFVESADKYEITNNLKGYLIRAVVNQSRTHLRNCGRRSMASLDEANQVAGEFDRPGKWIEINEEFQFVSRAISMLPEEQREAVILRLQSGLKFREIGEVQATTARTAISRYRYGIERLRSLLNGELINETDR